MATSGSFTKWSGNLYIKTDWSRTSVNVAGNTSTISFTVTIGGSYQVSSSATKNGSYTVNGSTGSFSFTVGTQSNNWSKQIYSSSMTIPHNSDGTKTFSLSAWADVNISLSSGYVGRLSVSGSSTLDSIPRASYFANLSSTVAAGSSLSYTITSAGSGLTHNIYYSFEGVDGWLSQGVASSGTWTFPMSALTSIPNSTSGTLRVYLRTLSGGTQIGEKSYTVTVTVPSSVVPSISNLTLARTGATIPSGWPSTTYVQNRSTVTATPTTAGAYGSTIVSTTLTLGSVNKSVNSGTPNATFSLPTAGTFTITAKVVDSRGRTASRTSSQFTVSAYSPPRITSVAITRSNANGSSNEEGTTGSSKVSWTFSAISTNAVSTALRYREKSSSTWTTVSGGLGTSGVAKLFATDALSTAYAYIVEATVTDSLGSKATYVAQIDAAFVTMDFKPGGTGVAFGKMSTLSDTVDFNMKILAGQGFISKRIPANANIHTLEYQQVGWYYCPVNVDVATISGTPPDNQAGALEVHTAAGTVQFWHNYGPNGRSWRRSLYLGSWSTWEIVHDPTDGIYQDFTPTWSQSSGGNLAIGNGSLTCRWTRIGNQVTANYSLIRGSTTNQGISPYVFSLPVSGRAYTEVHGHGWIYKSSGGTWTPINVVGVGTGAIGLMLATNGARLSNTVPSAWGTNDQIRWQVVYETNILKY